MDGPPLGKYWGARDPRAPPGLMPLWKCVTRNNVCWQTVPQPSTSSGEGSVSNSCTLRLADVQLMGQTDRQTDTGRETERKRQTDKLQSLC